MTHGNTEKMTADYDFSPDGAALCRALVKKAGFSIPEFSEGRMPLALGVYRGGGIVQLAAAGDMGDCGPSEFYRLSRESLWVQEGKESGGLLSQLLRRGGRDFEN